VTPAPDDVELLVLGPLAVRVGAEVVVPSGRQARLLASLALADARVVSADRLIDESWGDDPPESARAALHTVVARLRRALGAGGAALVRRAPGYALELPREARDSERFADLCRRARAVDPQSAVSALDEALALWRGPAWGDLGDDLARADAARLEEARIQAREDRADALLRAGRLGEAVADLEALVAEHPLRERGVGLLMDAVRRERSTADALEVFARHRRLLAEELGLDPSPHLQALYDRTLRQETADPPLAVADLPPEPVDVLPNNEEAGQGPGPAVAAVDRAPSWGLVGRTSELAALRRLIGQQRLVCVVGPGGVGKTRLVAHLAGELAGPTYWVDLAATSDSDAVPQLVADALGVEAHPGTPLLAALRLRAAEASGLLVLDSCEHLLDAVARLVVRLVQLGSKLHVVATSRERLGVEGEVVEALAPLALPSPDSADAQAPAVELFLRRARAVTADLPLSDPLLRRVGDICRSLDGLPLAIELAATRVGTLTVDDLADRLDRRLDVLASGSRTAPDRHRTLRAVVDWSYELLGEQERAVFARLAVFAAEFDLAAAERVAASDGLAASQVADVVGRLADQSMLVRPGTVGRGRYRMLETLREYALGQMSSDQLSLARRRHAGWVVELAEAAERGIGGPDEAAWVTRLDEVVDDIRAAWQWAESSGSLAAASRLVAALGRWAQMRIRPDVLRWGERLAALDRDAGLPRYAEAVAVGGFGAWADGRLDDARSLAESAVAAAGGPGEPAATKALEVLSDVCLLAGDLERSAAWARQAAQVSAAAGHDVDATLELANVTLAGCYAGEPVEGVLAETLRTAAASQSPTARAMALFVEGEVRADSDPDRAMAALEESRRVAEQVRNRFVGGLAMTSAISLRARHGEPGPAAYRLFAEAVAHWRVTGNRTLQLTTLRNLVILLVRAGADVAAVELAAAIAARTDIHTTYGEEARRLRDAAGTARSRLPERVSGEATTRGSARTLDDAARVVLRVLDGLQRSA
jgi:predicted ATPase/DNA-binding SARP family transcriptional activator